MDETELQMFVLFCQRNMPVPVYKHLEALRAENPEEWYIKATMVWPMVKGLIELVIPVTVHVETLFKGGMMDNRKHGGGLTFVYKDLGVG